MATSEWGEKGNVHIDMDVAANKPLPYHDVIAKLIVKYAKPGASIVDLGCGLGHIQRKVHAIEPSLVIDIADAYESCIDVCKDIPNAGDSYIISEARFNVSEVISKKYDVVVLSHVLEHLLFPAKALDDIFSILKEDGILIVAVPNPSRPNLIFKNLRRSHYVNRGHVHAWDPSHWRNFLEEIMGYKIIETAPDYIPLPAHRRFSMVRSASVALAKFAPWWGFSNIAVVKNSSAPSAFKKWRNEEAAAQVAA